MEFCVPTNWQRELTEELISKDKNREIKEIYGKLALDEVGGGRAASGLPFVFERELQEHVGELRKHGFKFNYLLNSLCMDNLEFTRYGQKKLRRLLDLLIKINVDSVTVANFYLLIWIKKNYPFLSTTVSVNAYIDTLKKAKFWEGLGADKITFPGPAINRNFNLLKLLRKNLNCQIQLIANNACIINCSTFVNHALMSSHASQKWHRCKGYVFDYYLIMCRLRRLNDPLNFIRADWIRPEDISLYEELGVDSIKLVDRRLPTDKILKIVNAYLTRGFQGNLMDLFPNFQEKSFKAHKGWIRKLFLLGDFLSINPVKVLRFSQLFSQLDIFIDNKQLDGFLQNMPKECDLNSCQACGYCKEVSIRTVKFDSGYLKNISDKYKEAMEKVFKSGF